MRPSMLLTAVAVAQALASSTTAVAPSARCAAKVNMEATLRAAQIDPRRADDTRTPGARCSVLVVEPALRAKHLLAHRWVDSYFGTKTIAAYGGWQRFLGYTGLAANGLPGKTSLRELGRGRFTVNHVVGPGRKVHRDGVVIDARTRDMLAEAERRLGRAPDDGPRIPIHTWEEYQRRH